MRLFLWATRRLHAFRWKDHILCIFVRYLHLYITITSFNKKQKKCVVIFLGEVLMYCGNWTVWRLDLLITESLLVFIKCTTFDVRLSLKHCRAHCLLSHVSYFGSHWISMFMHLIRLHWPVLHVEVPNFDGEVVTCHHIASAVTELHVRDGGDDLREEGSAAWVLRLLEDWKKKEKSSQSLIFFQSVPSMGMLQIKMCFYWF